MLVAAHNKKLDLHSKDIFLFFFVHVTRHPELMILELNNAIYT